MTLTTSRVKVNLSGLLNFRQLAKPYMLAAMTAAPLRGFLVEKYLRILTYSILAHVEEFLLRLRCSPLYINMDFGLESMGGNGVSKMSA